MEKGLLYFMNGNLQMAKLATRHLIEISPDERLRSSLLDDLHSLEKFENAILNIQGTEKIKNLSNMAEKNTEMAIDMKTFMNKDSDKLAEMLAKGYEKGISSIHENLQKFTDEREDVKELANGYFMFLKQTHAKYKGY
ncbi:MAG: hypothetical protein IJD80_05705 [Oscillospiraceae bacterium]|nr:hypothetical protein [Oscillospiraceae bacterium]